MLKSLLVSMEITQAGKAHVCRHNKSHRINKGEPRLSSRVDRDKHHYCVSCASRFAAASLEQLRSLDEQLRALAVKKG